MAYKKKQGRHKKPGPRRRKPPVVRAKEQAIKLLMKCRICENPIASFTTDKVSRPLSHEMFEGIDHTHTKPFFAGTVWVDFACPYCQNQPFWVTEQMASDWVTGTGKGPNEILTDKGLFHVDEKKMTTRQGDPVEMQGGWICNVCGADFKTTQALSGHKNQHRKKRAVNE